MFLVLQNRILQGKNRENKVSKTIFSNCSETSRVEELPLVDPGLQEEHRRRLTQPSDGGHIYQTICCRQNYNMYVPI